MNFLSVQAGHQEHLPGSGVGPEQVHVFEQDDILAVNAALAAKRPLLIRGEPGTGKSQLAAAVASVLKRAYVPFVVDAMTESRTLLWEMDAVRRLAEAQLSGALEKESLQEARERLSIHNYIKPGPLWWAFNWTKAEDQAKDSKSETPALEGEADPTNGVVVLIDEIDKAESDVPNGLLEALGAGQFTPLGSSSAIKVQEPEPLIIITSNEERMLPDAFVRRCLVHCLELPEPGHELINWLQVRGRAHFRHADDDVLQAAAEQVSQDRKTAIDLLRTPKPGQAEYLDLLRAVLELHPNDPGKQQAMLQRIGRFMLQKHIGTR